MLWISVHYRSVHCTPTRWSLICIYTLTTVHMKRNKNRVAARVWSSFDLTISCIFFNFSPNRCWLPNSRWRPNCTKEFVYERLYMKKFDSIQGTLNAAQPSDCGVFSCCDFENFYRVFPRLALEHADIQDKLILPNLFFRLTSLSRKVFESLSRCLWSQKDRSSYRNFGSVI